MTESVGSTAPLWDGKELHPQRPKEHKEDVTALALFVFFPLCPLCLCRELSDSTFHWLEYTGKTSQNPRKVLKFFPFSGRQLLK
jgi:hypothetical protein